MAYIGKQPVVGNFVKLDAITTSATATYNLLNGGVAYFPQTANNCIVSLNGVIQSPTSAYTISGSTIVFSDALTSSDSIDFILVLGDVLAIGTPSDGTITPSKLSTGVAGLFTWQSVQTTGFTAVKGNAYPCNTTSAGFTVTLPATPSVGDTIILLDYAGTFDTNALTISPNGNKIEGGTANLALTGEREGTSLVYIDSTQGWLAYSGINEGTDALSPAPYSVDFLVVAGGGGGGGGVENGGGGGAGGYRNSFSTETSGGNSSSESSLFFSVGTTYTITVGGGGSGGNGATVTGGSGVNSSISGSGITTITSSGGGGGGGYNTGAGALGGGSGGGDGSDNPSVGGSGTANQGFSGGTSTVASGSGGGGASAVGGNSTGSVGGNGGNGLASSITGSSVTRAGGGGGGAFNGTGGTGGTGGGGNGGNNYTNLPTAGTANTGGGGGGAGDTPAQSAPNGAAGGKGVVILRIPTANYSGTTTGSPTVTTDGSDKVIVFNDSGSITG
jgi:hypothetical protein